MSIVLKDGTVLPDIPAHINELCSYMAIIGMPDGSGYHLVASSEPCAMFPASLTGEPVDMFHGFGETFVYCLYSIGADEAEWRILVKPSNGKLCQAYAIGEEYYTLVWSNYNVFIAISMDDTAGTYTVGTEIYFPSSVASAPPFVLPDGTELPALPEGCFEKYPYGMISYVEITDGEAAYALSVAEGTYIFAPASATGEGSDYVISLLPGYRHYRYVVAPTAASGWEQYAESTTQHSGHDFSREDGTIEICWCNHDILTATAMNDDGTPEIGPDLYRKSDVNYRIYGGWLNSMGNQARRLGNVSGALKPGEMESVFSGATLEPLTVTPTTEEQTFTPESPCIGFSMVTVGAAPEQEIPDVPEPSYQDKTVTPSSEVQTVYPDSGYDALSSVTVEAIQVNQVVNNEEKTITENGTYTPSEGYTGFSSVTVEVPTYITVSSEDDLPSDSPEGTIAIVGG